MPLVVTDCVEQLAEVCVRTGQSGKVIHALNLPVDSAPVVHSGPILGDSVRFGRHRDAMTKPSPTVVKINSPGDVICALTRMLGFVPTDSVVSVFTKGPRCRFGLALRFDLDVTAMPAQFSENLLARLRHQEADGVFIVIFADSSPLDAMATYREFADHLIKRFGRQALDVLLVADQRWWSYVCRNPRCCGPAGTALDDQSRGATAIAAAYALAGQAVLPDRAALVRSIGYDGDHAVGMHEVIEAAFVRHAVQTRQARRLAVRALVARLMTEFADPRSSVTDEDAAELAALCEDVIVRDEVLVYAPKPEDRDVLLRVLRDVVHRIPPPYDAPICATFAWLAHSCGDGAIANIALDRVLATDPDYSLGLLIADALDRQVPPSVLQQVMREAASDLRRGSAAG
jgi:hypothetical protein